MLVAQFLYIHFRCWRLTLHNFGFKAKTFSDSHIHKVEGT